MVETFVLFQILRHILKPKRYSFMPYVTAVLVLTQHFDKTNFQETEGSVYAFDNCTCKR